MAKGDDTREYWRKRADSLYLIAVNRIISEISKDASSLIDVGSGRGSYVDNFDWIPDRASLDISIPYSSPTVRPIKADFLSWEADQYYDVCTCLQVLEHIDQAQQFAQTLLSTARIVVVAVPYKWKSGSNKTHIHDPVDVRKMHDWFGRKSNFTYKITEVDTGSPRLIQVYENDSLVSWESTNQRGRQRAG